MKKKAKEKSIVTSINLPVSTMEKVRQIKRMGDNPYKSMSAVFDYVITKGADEILDGYVHDRGTGRPAED